MIKPIIVIGMHRSGSTLLSKILEELDVFIGNDLDKYAESLFFQQINEWLLLQTRCSWDNPSNIKYIDNDYKNLLAEIVKYRLLNYKKNTFFGKSKNIKKDFFKMEHLWGWKDPRNTFTLNIWSQIFQKPLLIHIYRNPVDVANSLSFRENAILANTKIKHKNSKILSYKLPQQALSNISYKSTKLKGGFDLWKEYISQVLEINENHKNILHISYENLLKNTKQEILRISELLKIEITKEKLLKCNNLIDRNKIVKFTDDIELIEFYKTIKNNDLVKKMGYDSFF